MSFDLTTWNRLEPSARDPDLSAALSSRLADPLWLLARQWQSGSSTAPTAGARSPSASPPRRQRSPPGVPVRTARRPGSATTRPPPRSNRGSRPTTAPPAAREAAVTRRRFVAQLGIAGQAAHAAAFAQRWQLPAAAGPGDAAGTRLLGLLGHGLPDGAAMARDLRRGYGADGRAPRRPARPTSAATSPPCARSCSPTWHGGSGATLPKQPAATRGSRRASATRWPSPPPATPRSCWQPTITAGARWTGPRSRPSPAGRSSRRQGPARRR